VISEVQKQGGAGLAVDCDVTAPGRRTRGEGTVERFGRLNVLVNNAGTLHVSTVEGINEEDGPGDDGQCKGAVSDVAGGAAGVSKMGRGAIVNIGRAWTRGDEGSRGVLRVQSGVTMLTKAMAVDHGHENIRVNCICPSIVKRNW